MAIALRIDKVSLAGGQLHLEYTYGTAPLPAQPSGLGILFSSKQDLLDQIATDLELLPYTLLLAFLGRVWKAADSTLSNPLLVQGKTLTLILAATGLTGTVT